MKQHIAVSAIGTDRTGIVHDLTRVISECGGNISESRMASLGSEFAMVLLVSGNWHSLAKLETELKKLADASGLTVNLRRTEPRTARTDMLPIRMWQDLEGRLDVTIAALSSVIILVTLLMMIVMERAVGLSRRLRQ